MDPEQPKSTPSDDSSLNFSNPLKSAWSRALLYTAGLSMAVMPLTMPTAAEARGRSGGGGGGSGAAHFRDQNINVTSMLTSAIAAKEIFGEATVEIDVAKVWAPDGKISGDVSAQEMNLLMELLTFDQKLVAQTTDGVTKGKIDRLGPDYHFEEVAEGIWKIRRPLSLDAKLEITIGNGTIEGVVKQPLSFDWKVDGSYTSDGKLTIDIRIPLGFDAHMSGTITPLNQTP